MSSNHPKVGPNYVPAYQMSGIPFVTSSATDEVLCPDSNGASPVSSLQFPFVTKAFTIRNIGKNDLRVGFSERGMFKPGEERMTALHDGTAKPHDDTKNYFVIPSSGSGDIGGDPYLYPHVYRFEVRCKELFFVSDAAPVADPLASKATHGTGYMILAELTNINADQFPILTGSVSSSLGPVEAFQGIG